MDARDEKEKTHIHGGRMHSKSRYGSRSIMVCAQALAIQIITTKR
jgi:hypothetical protein